MNLIDWQVREIHLRPRDDESWDSEIRAYNAKDAAIAFAEETFEDGIRAFGGMPEQTVEVRKLSLAGRKTRIHRVTVKAHIKIDWSAEFLKARPLKGSRA